MHGFNWRRVVLCGFIAGTIWTLLSILVVSAVGGDFFAALSGQRVGVPVVQSNLPLYLLSVSAGIGVMALYVLIRPQLASNGGAAVTAGLVWWGIASLQSLKWVVILALPAAVWLPLTSSVIPFVLATLIGARLYGTDSPTVRVPTGMVGV